jgi:hypothetical protein
MTDVGLLHNMSVPPRSTVQVSRSALPGLRYFVDCRWLSPTIVQGLRSEGAAAMLALLQNGDGNVDEVTDKTSKEVEERALDCLTLALADRGVPRQIGVFVPEDHRPRDVHRLSRAATLAVLARRSGPLYLPRRRFNPSLIAPLTAVLVFPEE